MKRTPGRSSHLRALLLGAALPIASCGEVVRDPAELPRGAATFCGEAAAQTPRVLVSGAGDGVLLGAGDALYLVEAERRVLRIDRCTGQWSELASSDEPGNVAATVHGDHVYWVSGGDGPRSLFRVPTAGGERQLVTDALPELDAIDAVGDRMLLKSVRGGPGQELNVVDVDAIELAVVPAQAPSPTLVFRSEDLAYTGGSYSGFEVEAAGFFMQRVVHGNPALPLARIPLDGGERADAEGTLGATTFSATARWIYYVSGHHAAPRGLLRAPTTGGAFEALLPESDMHLSGVRFLVSDDVDVCWASFSGPPGCLAIGAADGPRTLDAEASSEAVARRLVLAGDGVYWLRKPTWDAPVAEVIGAAR